MKNKFIKVLSKILNWLHWNWEKLVMIIITITALIITIFAPLIFSQDNKECKQERNQITKKEAFENNFETNNLTFQVGTMAPYNTLNVYFEFYYNINYILFTFDNRGLEINLNYNLITRVKYINEIGYNYYARYQEQEQDLYFVVDTRSIVDITQLECLRIDINTNVIDYEGGWYEETAGFDLGIYEDIRFILNNEETVDTDFLISDVYTSYSLDGSNLPVSVRQSLNSIISEIDDIRAITAVRSNSFIFNTNYAGYHDGYYDGENNGYINGFEDGENTGYTTGYQDGYNQGLNDGSEDFGILNFISNIFTAVFNVLQVEILPNIRLIYILSVPLILGVLKFVIGLFR